jgi:hypothetical protein
MQKVTVSDHPCCSLVQTYDYCIQADFVQHFGLADPNQRQDPSKKGVGQFGRLSTLHTFSWGKDHRPTSQKKKKKNDECLVKEDDHTYRVRKKQKTRKQTRPTDVQIAN